MATITGSGNADLRNDTIGRADLYDMLGGADTVYAGVGADTVYGGNDSDLLYGGNDNDLLYGGNDGDLIFGGTGADTLFGDAGNDTLSGNEGGDLIVGGANIDTASYETSNAAVSINILYSEVSGGHAAGDTLGSIENVIGSGFNDTLIGDSGNNVLSGLSGTDSITGNAGQDTIIGGAGADSLFGGGGADTADYSASGSGVNVNISDLLTETGGDAQGDLLVSIENLIGSNSADILTGTASSNVLSGLGGDDTITGGLGNDIISGGDGSDRIVAGPDTVGPTVSPINLVFDWTTSTRTGGADIRAGFTDTIGGAIQVEVDYDIVSPPEGNSSTFAVNAGASSDGGPIFVGAGEPFDQNSSVQMLHPASASGSQVAISFTSASGSNYSGEVSNVTFRLADLDNNEEATVFAYDAFGNLRPVVITETSAVLDVTGGGTVSSTSQNNLGTDSPNGSALVTIAGPVSYIVIQFNDASNGADEIFISNIHFTANPIAGADDDSVLGGTGNDSIFGGIGNDTLSGEAGSDSLYGGAGADRLFGGADNDTILGDVGADSLDGGTGDDRLFGGADNDTILGDVGADSLDGGAGDDRLFGGAGNDTVNAGAGNDLI